MALKVIDFVVILDNGIRKRHYHEAEKNKVINFVVQLEAYVNGKWKTIVRYDCSHGFSHKDSYDIDGNQTKTPLELSFESALTFADWDIKENWENYCIKFLNKRKK